MKRPGRAVAIALLLIGCTDLGASLAARMLQPRFAAPANACGSPHLASPDYQGPDTLDYFVEENVVTATSTVAIHLAAYAVRDTENLGTPSFVGSRVLDGSYNVLTNPVESGTWQVDSNPCAPKPLSGRKSDRYYFEGTWATPINPGAYELAVTTAFADGTVVNYLINMEVVGQDVRRLPRFNSYVRDAVELHGINEALQNSASRAYNLTALPTQLEVVSTYYFQGDPAPRAGQSRMANAMLNPDISAHDVFQNIDSSGDGGRGGADNRITLPPSGQTAPFSYQQTYVGGDGQLHAIGQTGSATVEPYDMPAGVISDQSYTYRVVLREPVSVSTGDAQHPTYLLKVGSYAVDNGFYGPVADGLGTVGLNFGDGQGLTLYANPGPALLDTSPDHHHCDGDTARTCVYWAPVPSSAVGEHTAVIYHLSILDRSVPRGEDPLVASADTTTPWADLDPRLFSTTGTVTYTAYVQAEFDMTDDSGKTIPPIRSDSMQSFVTTGAPGATTTPTATTTSSPTSTPTNTPLPTATPTPHGLATVVQTPEAYAWIRTSHGEDATAQDALIPTTGHTNDPAHFFWQVGRPLHLIPAAMAHPQDTALTLLDSSSGEQAVLHPTRIENDWYQLSSVGAACTVPSAVRLAYGSSPAYPDEIDPDKGTPLIILWASHDTPDDLPAGAIRCDLDRTMAEADHTDATVNLAYTVQQHLIFDVTFDPAHRAGVSWPRQPRQRPAARPIHRQPSPHRALSRSGVARVTLGWERPRLLCATLIVSTALWLPVLHYCGAGPTATDTPRSTSSWSRSAP